MKKTAILLVSTLMLGVSASAMADSNRWNNHHDHKDRYEQRYDRNDHRNDHRDPPRWSNAERGNHYGQRINFKRGERLPSAFRSNRYVVSNYRLHRLYENHHVVITGCRYRANMYWWIQNTASIGLHNMSDQKQASSLLFLFMPVHHLVVVVSYLQEVVVPALCFESPMDSSTKQNGQSE